MAAYVPFQLKDQADRSSQSITFFLITGFWVGSVDWFDGELPRDNKYNGTRVDIIKHNVR
jgi:hypothetical protein